MVTGIPLAMVTDVLRAIQTRVLVEVAIQGTRPAPAVMIAVGVLGIAVGAALLVRVVQKVNLAVIVER